MKYVPAEADARKVIELNPEWVRGHSRLGAALEGQHRWAEAVRAYHEASGIDPANDAIIHDLEHAQLEAETAKPIGAGLPEFIDRLLAPGMIDQVRYDSRTSYLFADPEFAAMAEDIKADAANIKNYSRTEPRYIKLMQAILTVVFKATFGDPMEDDSKRSPGAADAPPPASSSDDDEIPESRKLTPRSRVEEERRQPSRSHDEEFSARPKPGPKSRVEEIHDEPKRPKSRVEEAPKAPQSSSDDEFSENPRGRPSAEEAQRTRVAEPPKAPQSSSDDEFSENPRGRPRPRVEEVRDEVESAPRKDEPTRPRPPTADPKRSHGSSDDEFSDNPRGRASADAAAGEKALGNDAFNAGDMNSALRHYDRAIELDPTNVTYYNNKATVLGRLNCHDEAVSLIKQAIDIGRRNRQPYEVIARAFQKLAVAYRAQNNYPAAIEALKSSLAEKNDPAIKKELRRLEDTWQRQKAAAYEDPTIAEREREAGNEVFKNGDLPGAIARYTEAIKRAPRNPLLYLNRAAAYQRLGELPIAVADCDQALAIDPNFAKAYTRKGYCHLKMKEFHRARECYDSALRIDPNNADAIDGLQNVSDEIAKSRYSEPDEERLKRAAADPEIKRILQDPGMQQIMKDLQENPAKFSYYMADPKIGEGLLKLRDAGFIR
jgi:stress-induced-phosphoprotein 1